MHATLMLGQTTFLKESISWNRSQVLIFCSWAKARAFTFMGGSRGKTYTNEWIQARLALVLLTLRSSGARMARIADKREAPTSLRVSALVLAAHVKFG
jgi:hypothetical protein